MVNESSTTEVARQDSPFRIRLLLPIVWEIDPWKRACGAKNCTFSNLRSLHILLRMSTARLLQHPHMAPFAHDLE